MTQDTEQNDGNQERVSEIKSMLLDMRSRSDDHWLSIRHNNLLTFLKENKCAPNNESIQQLEQLPEIVQNYIRDELYAYIRGNAPITNDDARFIAQFLNTLRADCQPDTYLSEQMYRALAAAAWQLRDYYGREEDDEEPPCWP